MPHWLQAAAYIAACLLMPILWGWAVNWAFHRLLQRPPNGPGSHPAASPADASAFHDYQI
jgi:hypothetical protein